MIYIKLFLLITLSFVLAVNSFAARSITFPHTENFDGTAWLSDIVWYEGTGNVTRVESSWRGAGNYCARLDPSTTAAAGGGTNGGVVALGAFDFSSTNILNVAFALNVGTTYSDTAANAGGSLINKFIDIFGASNRAGLLGLNNRGSCSAHEFGLLDSNTEVYYYYGVGGVPVASDPNCRSIHFDDGVGNSLDYAGKWIFINYVVNNTNGDVIVRIWDREGNFSSNWLQIEDGTNMAIVQLKTLGGYYNEYHPTADSNSRLLIDDLTLSNSASTISPPTGFITSGEDATATFNGITFNGASLY